MPLQSRLARETRLQIRGVAELLQRVTMVVSIMLNQTTCSMGFQKFEITQAAIRSPQEKDRVRSLSRTILYILMPCPKKGRKRKKKTGIERNEKRRRNS